MFGCPKNAKIPRDVTEAFIIALDVEPEAEDASNANVCQQPSTDDDETCSNNSLSRMSPEGADDVMMPVSEKKFLLW